MLGEFQKNLPNAWITYYLSISIEQSINLILDLEEIRFAARR